MLIYGKNACKEVLKSNIKINSIYLMNNFSDKEILKLIGNKKYVYKSNSDMDKLVKESHQGVIMDIEDYTFTELKTIKEDNNSNFIVILDHIEDPRNFGAIIRTCECAGVDYIIIPNKGNALITNVVMKTSAGALANTKICKVANLRNTILELKKHNYWIIGTDAKGQDYTKIDYSGKVALVIGSEGNGLKQIVSSSCDMIASIPLKGKVNSLNASVSAGIMIYEVLKYRSEQ